MCSPALAASSGPAAGRPVGATTSRPRDPAGEAAHYCVAGHPCSRCGRVAYGADQGSAGARDRRGDRAAGAARLLVVLVALGDKAHGLGGTSVCALARAAGTASHRRATAAIRALRDIGGLAVAAVGPDQLS